MRTANPLQRTVRAVAALALIAAACHSPEVAVPEEMLGIWESDHAAYEGRQLELFEDAILFRASREEYTVHALQEFSCRGGTVPERSRFRVAYAEGGSIVEVTLAVDEEGVLVFESRPGVRWRRVRSGEG